MDENNAIELRNICLSYDYDVKEKTTGFLNRTGIVKKKKIVIDDLSLDIKKGEVVGILGTNGAGKSTLLSIIARILDPDSGTVSISGKVATILELGMGFHNDLTGRENIILKGELYGFSKKEMELKADEIINYSGINEYADSPLRMYSSGMRSRLAFSIMIHIDAEIMLVDEILSTGDAAFSIKAKDYFKKILQSNKTVIYVSHSPGAVESLCSRAIWLDKGKIIADGRPKKVCKQYYEASLNSFDVILDQAESGLPDAQYRLAQIYKTGRQTEPNEDEYMKWLQLAAEQGVIDAQIELADILINSENEDDRETALDYYKFAASRGNEIARLRVANILGDYDSWEYTEIKRILNRAAINGNPSDIYTYGIFLLKTAKNTKDQEEAYLWIKGIADQFNHPDALMQLATMFYDGIGTKKDDKAYILTLEKAHELGIIKATKLLADAYYQGIIVEEDPCRAFELYKKCAINGLVPCQYTIAEMYLEGKGTIPSLEESKKWFKIYSKSQLNQYRLMAIKMANNHEDENFFNFALEELKNNMDYKSIIEVINISKNTYNREQLIETLDSCFDKLSMLYGRGMLLAYDYYSKIDSIGYNLEKSQTLVNKMIYTGNPEILFLYATQCEEKPITDELRKKCLILSAKQGYDKAIKMCVELGIPFNE